MNEGNQNELTSNQLLKRNFPLQLPDIAIKPPLIPNLVHQILYFLQRGVIPHGLHDEGYFSQRYGSFDFAGTNGVFAL